MNLLEHIKYRSWLFWQQIFLVQVGKSLLAVFGGLWGIVEILDYFNQSSVAIFLKSSWWAFLILGVVIVIYRHWPKTYYFNDVTNRDVRISIRIGDILKLKDSVVIPINNLFDSNNNGIVSKSSSILKFFIKERYANNHTHLNTDIEIGIEEDNPYFNGQKKSSNPDKYEIGTVVALYKNEQHCYLLANSILNEQGRSKCTEEDLRNSLSGLWSFLDSNGNKDILNIPILGTGRGRLNLKRTAVIKEMVLSFITSLSTGSYIEELCIVIHPKDLLKQKIDIIELSNFIQLHCDNTNFKEINNIETGTGIE